jgi:hypothetical protein
MYNIYVEKLDQVLGEFHRLKFTVSLLNLFSH